MGNCFKLTDQKGSQMRFFNIKVKKLGNRKKLTLRAKMACLLKSTQHLYRTKMSGLTASKLDKLGNCRVCRHG